MVKLLTVVMAITTALPSLTTAARCTTGLRYCGYNLLKKGMLFICFLPGYLTLC